MKAFAHKDGNGGGRAYRLIYNAVKINSVLKGKQGQQSFQDPKLTVATLSLSKKERGVGGGALRSSYLISRRSRVLSLLRVRGL